MVAAELGKKPLLIPETPWNLVIFPSPDTDNRWINNIKDLFLPLYWVFENHALPEKFTSKLTTALNKAGFDGKNFFEALEILMPDTQRALKPTKNGFELGVIYMARQSNALSKGFVLTFNEFFSFLNLDPLHPNLPQINFKPDETEVTIIQTSSFGRKEAKILIEDGDKAISISKNKTEFYMFDKTPTEVDKVLRSLQTTS